MIGFFELVVSDPIRKFRFRLLFGCDRGSARLETSIHPVFKSQDPIHLGHLVKHRLTTQDCFPDLTFYYTNLGISPRHLGLYYLLQVN
jgi:hypothetical protein